MKLPSVGNTTSTVWSGASPPPQVPPRRFVAPTVVPLTEPGAVVSDRSGQVSTQLASPKQNVSAQSS